MRGEIWVADVYRDWPLDIAMAHCTARRVDSPQGATHLIRGHVEQREFKNNS